MTPAEEGGINEGLVSLNIKTKPRLLAIAGGAYPLMES